MATIGVGTGNYIRPRKAAGTELRSFPVDTSQTILVGSLLVLSADSDEGNRVKVAGTDPTTDRAIVGFAAEAITTGATFVAATDKVLVWLAKQDTQFIVHCEDAGTIDNDDVSVEYGVVVDATNLITRLDRTETSAKVFRVIELLDVHGDVNGRLAVTVIAPERLYGD